MSVQTKIGVIAHYSGMRDAFQHLGQEKNCKLIFKIGVLDLAIGAAIELEREYGVSAIITNLKTAQAIEHHVTVPVIPLHVRSFNLISAFYKARQQGTKLAFAEIHKDFALYDFEQIKRLMDYDISYYGFDEISEVDGVLDLITDDERDIVVTGASCMLAKASLRGIKSILLEPEKCDLIDAIDAACNIIMVKNAEAKKTRWIRTVVDASNEGILTLDQNGDVSVVSQQAEKIIGMSEDALRGDHIGSLKDSYLFFQSLSGVGNEIEVIQHNAVEIVVTRKEVEDDGGVTMGTVYHLQKLQTIQSVEMQTRKKLNQKGFVAVSTFDDIKGTSVIIRDVKEHAKKFARTHSNILIHGESGSGKEIFAQSIHNYSKCSEGPFLAINCATLPEPLLESELFGYEDGAFTGAKKGGKQGLLEMAHGGTVFLDEIGEMPIQLQSRLLRVLQEKVVRRVGGDRNIPINVRIISATNRDLTTEIAEGRFREDLYYRIGVLSLRIPALLERKEDIAQIAQMFVRTVAAQNEKLITVDFNCLELLKNYEWYGNVRELHNFIERLVVLSENGIIDTQVIEQLAGEQVRHKTVLTPAGETAPVNALVIPVGSMREMENTILSSLYCRYDGDKKALERVLKMSGTTLWRRLKELGP